MDSSLMLFLIFLLLCSVTSLIAAFTRPIVHIKVMGDWFLFYVFFHFAIIVFVLMVLNII